MLRCQGGTTFAWVASQRHHRHTNQLGFVSVTMSVHYRAFPAEPGQNENLNLISFTRRWFRMEFHKTNYFLNILSQSSTCCMTELLDQDGRRLREGCEEVSRGRCFWFFPQLRFELRWLHCWIEILCHRDCDVCSTEFSFGNDYCRGACQQKPPTYTRSCFQYLYIYIYIMI